MLSKEIFIETIKLMQTKNEHQEALIKALELCSPYEYINAFIYSEYEAICVKLLHEGMGLPKDNDIIEYWLCDLNYGQDFQPGCIKNEGNYDVVLKTSEDLYNYILSLIEKD